MAEFKVGDRVNCTFDPDNKDDPWNGVGTVERSRTHDLTKVRLDSGRFANLTDAEMTPVVETFQLGDIVRAEKGDEIIQGKIRDKGLDVWGINLRTDSLEKDNYTLALVERTEQQQAKLVVMPTDPGMYEGLETEKTNAEDGKWHYDSKRFFYLNSDRVWTDVGWGFPTVLDGKLTRLEPVDE